MKVSEIISKIESGEVARLIPSVADTSREVRVTSSLLATWMVVPAFADSILRLCNGLTGTRKKITCYTEVVFRGETGKRKFRPDGLVVVTSGSRSWSALVESKVGNAALSAEQIECYLDLAKANGIDAVITLSNQFALVPSHHPVPIAKTKLRNVSLFHFSWHAVLSQAVLIAQNNQVEDPEQAYILEELLRYLKHEASGVVKFTQMGPCWRQVCADIQQGVEFKKSNEHVIEAVQNWHQLIRSLAIQFSIDLSKPVRIAMTKSQILDPTKKLSEGISSLIGTNCLSARFEVPDAASGIDLVADFRRRTLNLSMKLQAPKDRTRPTASANWLLRQLPHLTESDILLRTSWPNRIPNTTVPLREVFLDPKVILSTSSKDIPTSFEILKVIDRAGRFRGSKTFVEDVEAALPAFYEEVGQHLRAWSPRPPKFRTKEAEHGSEVEDATDGLDLAIDELVADR